MSIGTLRISLMLAAFGITFVLFVIATLVMGWISKDYISSGVISMPFMLAISFGVFTNLTRLYFKHVLRAEDVELSAKESSQARVQFVSTHLMLLIMIIFIAVSVFGPEAVNLPVNHKWLTASFAFIAGAAGIAISIKTTKWTLSYKTIPRETTEQ